MTEWISLLAAFTHALRHQLRHSDPKPDLDRLLSPDLSAEVLAARYRPAILLTSLGPMGGNATAGRPIRRDDGHGLRSQPERSLRCTRRLRTPGRHSLAVPVLRHDSSNGVYLYCFLLPFGLVGTLGMMTPVMSVLVAYTFMALEALAEEIEEPFGTLPNDLPLEEMSGMIEETLLEMAGKEIPENRSEPRKFVPALREPLNKCVKL